MNGHKQGGRWAIVGLLLPVGLAMAACAGEPSDSPGSSTGGAQSGEPSGGPAPSGSGEPAGTSTGADAGESGDGVDAGEGTTGLDGGEGGDCHDDAECAPGGHCIAGTCIGTQDCGPSYPCADGLCLEGRCVECIDDTDCTGVDAMCVADACTEGVECNERNACENGSACVDGTCEGAAGCSLALPGECGECVACFGLPECLDDPGCVEAAECFAGCAPLGPLPSDPCAQMCSSMETGIDPDLILPLWTALQGCQACVG